MSDSKSKETRHAAHQDQPQDDPAAGTSATPGKPKEEASASLQMDELASVKAEAAANYERYLRAVADLENFKRRSVREKDELRQFANARVFEELLPVLDNLARALDAARLPNADLAGITGGVEMVLSQLKGVLTNNGIEEVSPLGKPFDAHQHDALSEQPSAEVPAGQVLTVIRTGYVLNGRLLRPASVIVSGGAPRGNDEANGPA